MNFEAMDISLRQIRAGVIRQSGQLQVGTVVRDSNSYNELKAELLQWGRILKGMQSSLISDNHLNALVYRQNRFGENSYSAGQRFRDKSSNNDMLLASAEQLAQEIARLLALLESGGNPAGVALDGIGKGSKELGKFLEDLIARNSNELGARKNELVASVRLAEQGEGGGMQGSYQSPVVSALVVLIGVYALIQTIRKRNA